MKKTMGLISASLFALAVGACGGAQKEETTPEPMEPPAATETEETGWEETSEEYPETTMSGNPCGGEETAAVAGLPCGK